MSAWLSSDENQLSNEELEYNWLVTRGQEYQIFCKTVLLQSPLFERLLDVCNLLINNTIQAAKR